MIIKNFNNGWGDGVPLKALEQQIVDQYLAHDNRRTVLINSTWYTQDYHNNILNQLHQLNFDQIVLVSMLDASIPQPNWYNEFNCAVRGLGYYRGADTIDFWALTVAKHFQQPSYDCQNEQLIDKAYMCLNRKPHWHRKRLYNHLLTFNLLDQGIVSMGGNSNQATRLLEQDQGECDLAPNAGTEQTGIANDIMSLGHEQNWTRHFLNIVTETQFDIKQTYFVSEKIYKPIVGFKPFLVYASDGAVEWLTERKFEPYTQDFKDLTDLDLANPNNLPHFLNILCQQPANYWRSKYLALKDKIVYNNSNFYNYIKGMACQI